MNAEQLRRRLSGKPTPVKKVSSCSAGQTLSSTMTSLGTMTLKQPTLESGGGTTTRKQEVGAMTTRSLSNIKSLSFRQAPTKGKMSILERRQLKKSCSEAQPSELQTSKRPGSAAPEKIEVSHRPLSTDSNQLSKLNLSLNLGRSQQNLYASGQSSKMTPSPNGFYPQIIDPQQELRAGLYDVDLYPQVSAKAQRMKTEQDEESTLEDLEFQMDAFFAEQKVAAVNLSDYLKALGKHHGILDYQNRQNVHQMRKVLKKQPEQRQPKTEVTSQTVSEAPTMSGKLLKVPSVQTKETLVKRLSNIEECKFDDKTSMATSMAGQQISSLSVACFSPIKLEGAGRMQGKVDRIPSNLAVVKGQRLVLHSFKSAAPRLKSTTAVASGFPFNSKGLSMDCKTPTRVLPEEVVELELSGDSSSVSCQSSDSGIVIDDLDATPDMESSKDQPETGLLIKRIYVSESE